MRSSIGMIPIPITGILWVNWYWYRNGSLSSVCIGMNHKPAVEKSVLAVLFIANSIRAAV